MTNEIKEIKSILSKNKKYITYSERGYILDFIFNLLEDNRFYLRRIEKAVDYIISTYHDKPTELYGLVCADELLDILRGDE